MTDEILSSGLLEILSDFIVLGVLLMCFIEKLIQVVEVSGKDDFLGRKMENWFTYDNQEIINAASNEKEEKSMPGLFGAMEDSSERRNS